MFEVLVAGVVHIVGAESGHPTGRPHTKTGPTTPFDTFLAFHEHLVHTQANGYAEAGLSLNVFLAIALSNGFANTMNNTSPAHLTEILMFFWKSLRSDEPRRIHSVRNVITHSV